jgi:hypothetical protein
MKRALAFGTTKVLFALAITAVSVLAVQTLNSNPISSPKPRCPCSCPYPTMCSGPPACVCIVMGDY